MVTPPTHEPGVLPLWIDKQGADTVIVSGMGEKARQLLREKGIETIIAASKRKRITSFGVWRGKGLVDDTWLDQVSSQRFQGMGQRPCQ
jgi:hypothetical protein